MKDKPFEMFAIADAGSIKRIPYAIALSLLANVLFLAGASTLMREEAVQAPDNSGYIVLDRIDRASPQQAPPIAGGLRPPSEATRRRSTPERQFARAPITDRARKVAARPAHAAKTEVTSVGAAEAAPVETPVVPAASRVAALEAASLASKPGQNKPTAAAEPVLLKREGAGGGSEGTKTAVSSAFPGETSGTEAGAGAAPAVQPDSSARPESSAAPVPTVEPVGETKGAESARQELPRLPDALRESGYRSFVRVRVEVAAAGDFSVTILTSSGNPDIDARVLDALKRWEWKPALKNGVPVTSTEVLRFDFDVD